MGHVCWSQQPVQDLRAHLDGLGTLYDHRGRDLMLVIKQRHVQMVHVPAGHMHQVENMLPGIKVAFDKYVPANLARYVLSWQYVTSQIARTPDYMCVAIVVKNAIARLHLLGSFEAFNSFS